MHIVQSDTSFDDPDHDIDVDCAAEDIVLEHLKVKDLDMHRSNPWSGPVTKESANDSRFFYVGPRA